FLVSAHWPNAVCRKDIARYPRSTERSATVGTTQGSASSGAMPRAFEVDASSGSEGSATDSARFTFRDPPLPYKIQPTRPVIAAVATCLNRNRSCVGARDRIGHVVIPTDAVLRIGTGTDSRKIDCGPALREPERRESECLFRRWNSG